MKPPAKFVGLDFGTTNTAVAVANDAGVVELVQLPGTDGGLQSMWRTVLFFDPTGRQAVAGAPAVAAYLDAGGDGRWVQSIKSHLASASFTKTTIGSKTWHIEEMIATYLNQLRAASPYDLGKRVVVGRPVRYWGAEDPADDARAIARMETALAKAGFDEAVFEFEPLGAAARYATGLDHDELIAVADFGGGTSDFSIVRVGPSVKPGDPSAILATGGIGIGGDSFDARIIDAVVAPALGKGTKFAVEFGAQSPVPAWIYSNLRRWHHLSFLKAPDTLRLLERIRSGALEPKLIERLVRMVHDDLGLQLHRSVERSKIELTAAATGRLQLAEGIDLDATVARVDFDGWLEEDLARIDAVLDRVLADAGVDASQIDRVFATGGSSLVPVVRARLAARFGPDRLVGGNELTSVAWGLAARARQLFS